MHINVLYFASLAESAQADNEKLNVEDDMTLPQLYAQLKDKYHFNLEQSQLRVAINDEFASWDDKLQDADTVAFIPPVAGG